MKKTSLKISSAVMAIVAVFLAINAGNVDSVAAADSETQAEFEQFCFENGIMLNPDSPYSNIDLGAEDTMSLYHAQTNEKFNGYIRTLMTAQSNAAKSAATDVNAAPPEDGSCTAANYSTYCVAKTMLLGEPLFPSEECRNNDGLTVDAAGNFCYNGEGYVEYMKSLSCRREFFFDDALEIEGFKTYSETFLLDEEAEAETAKIRQLENVLQITERAEGITREIASAKRALDQTLAAYDELKTAWPMHKRYMEIYGSLVKFRDKMVEIRHQVEQYPNKFLDATTTMCT